MKKNILICICLCLGGTAFAQQADWSKEQKDLEAHVYKLASDEFEGRETGMPGETMAANYIKSYFKQLGLIPKGDEGTYIQTFSVLAGKNFGKSNYAHVDKIPLELNTEFYPLEISGNGLVKGNVVDVHQGVEVSAEGVNDYEGKKNLAGSIFLIDINTPEPAHPHAGVVAFQSLRKKVEVAEKKGAAAVIFWNSNEDTPAPIPDYTRNVKPFDIPVIFVSETKKLASLKKKKAQVSVELIEDRRPAKNVLGYLDNKADLTIIVGGHYDHLGYGSFGSRYMGTEKLVHNGADDNASGIALTLELADQLVGSGFNEANVLFICFSGEEMGLLGSKYYVEHPTVPFEEVSFMVNLDMVGRMKNRTLIINGTGTSPSWGSLLSTSTPKGWKLNVSTNESGIGPSDHTSFYLTDLPVLAFFTGVHDDYHHPADDAEKLNYKGMSYIGEFLENLVRTGAKEAKLEFTKTKDKSQEGRKRFSVTMGVLPSYAYDGEGMQIDGVSAGKPAEAAGLKAGDVIIGIGDMEIKDIYGYMDALGQLKKGQESTVKVKRGDEILELDITF